MRLVIPPHEVVGVCARGRFSLLILAVDFCRRLPVGAVSHRRQGGSDGLLCVRRADGGAWVHDEFALFCYRRQNKADLFFSPSLVLVCLSRQISLPSRRLREQKNLFTSIQGIHKTRRLIIKTLQNLTCPDETSSAQPIKGCCLRGGLSVSKAVHYYFCFV